jgi:hypothetical protein
MPKKFDIDQPAVLHTLLEILYPEDRSRSRCILSDDRVLYRSEDSVNYNMFDFYADFFVGTKFQNIVEPHILLHACFSMPWFEKIRYDQSTVAYLNEKGLSIYLMEPIFLYTGDKKRFYRDLLITPQGGLDLEQIQTCFPSGIEDYRSFELDSIEEFLSQNQLNNVTVYLETSGGHENLKKIYPSFSTATIPLFPLTYRNNLDDYSGYQCFPEQINKKFICGNWRYEPHRHIVAAFMTDLDCDLSWKEEASIEFLRSKSWFDLDSFPYFDRIKRGCEDLVANPRGPLEGPEIDTDSCPTGKRLPTQNYTNAFCTVINEPFYAYPFALFSEKVINSMMLEKPFIIVGPSGTIKYLKSLGFETFDRWWSEDYDSISDHTQRLLEVLRLIDCINKIPIDEIRNLYREMGTVLKHNKHQINHIRER